MTRLFVLVAGLLLLAFSSDTRAEQCVDFDITQGVCTDKQASPWRYQTGLTESYPRHLRAECSAKGGTLVSGVCQGGTEPQDEAGVLPLAIAIGQAFFPVCGSEGVTSDSGWGNFERPYGYGDLCDIGNDSYETQCRWIGVAGRDPTAQGCGDAQVQTLAVYSVRHRQPSCPNGYQEIQTSQGPRCFDVPCGGSDCLLNGVQPSTMANFHEQPMHRASGSALELTARWGSQGAFEPADGQPGPAEKAKNIGWTHDYDKRVYEIVGTPGLMAVAHGPDGRPRHYGPDGMALQPWEGGKDRMVRLVGPGGTTAGWQRITNAGVVEHYDAEGYLMAREGRGAERIDIQYDAARNIESVTDQSGRSIIFVHDASGRLASIVLPDGETIAHTYDQYGQLIRTTWPDQSFREYRYDTAGMLTEVVDEKGEVIEKYEYWSRGEMRSRRLAPSLNAGQGVNAYTFSNSRWFGYTDNNTSVSDPRGGSVTFSYRNVGGVSKLTSQSARCEGCGVLKNVMYDANGWRSFSTDFAGVATRYEHDVLGLETKRLEGMSTTGAYTCPAGSTAYASDYGTGCGTGTCWSQAPFEGSSDGRPLGWTGWHYSCKLPPATGPAQRTIETDWDVAQRLKTETRVYDADNALVEQTSWAHNARGQVVAINQVDPGTNAQRSVTLAYCEAGDTASASSHCPLVGLLKSVDGPLAGAQDLTRFQYYGQDDVSGCDTGGACHRIGDLWRVVNPLGQVTEYARYDRAGRPARVIDANGVVTDLAYNARGWLVSRKVRGADNGPEADDAITSLDYDAVGNVEQVTQPDGSTMAFEYDAAHRLVAVEDALGNRIEYTLDRAGQTLQEQIRDPGGTIRHSLSRVYDTLGQLSTLADAQANPTDFTYDAVGNADTVTDALGRVNDLDHDPLGRLVQSIANVNGSGAERAVTGMAYDALDRLVSVTDPKGLTTQYTYDGLGNLVELDSPDTGVASYGYDAAGNRTRVLDARGVQRYYSYDALGRLTGVDVPTVGEDTSLVYDAAPVACQPGETFAAGRLVSLINYAGTTDYCYDRRGNVARKVQAVANGPTRAVAYQHDLADRVSRITYPSGAVVTYQRDATGRISGVQVKRTPSTAVETLVSEITYQPFGPLSQITFGNGRVLSMAHDQDFAVESIEDSVAGGLSLGLTHDAVGNVVGIDERLNDGATASRGVDYDGLDRLTAMTNGASVAEGFSYDATGNRLSRTTTSTVNYSYPSDSHRLVKVGSQNRVYDAAGNSTSIHSKHFTYDDYGRMRQFINGTTLRNEYLYNGRGERVAKLNITSPGSTRYFVYDEAGRLLGEYNPAGTAVKEYVWLDDRPVAVLGSYQGHRFQYVLTDHLGTPRAVVNPPTNAIIWRWDLTASAFGSHGVQANPDGDGANYALNLRYPGQYYDGETKLHYNYFRDYDPATGRYVQSDPIGLGGGANTFAYAHSIPLLLSDPLGLDPRLFSLPLEGKAPVRGRGGRRPLTAADRRLFDEAVLLARQKFRECECTCPDPGRGYCFQQEDKDAILEMFEQTDFYYDGNWRPGAGSGLRYEPLGALLYREAFTNGLDWLAATLIHESVHRTGRRFSDEPTAYLIDDRCFGFQNYAK